MYLQCTVRTPATSIERVGEQLINRFENVNANFKHSEKERESDARSGGVKKYNKHTYIYLYIHSAKLESTCYPKALQPR